jgi:nicotinamide riboside transporter PnuC
MPPDAFKVFLCGALVVAIACIIVRDIRTGVSGVGGVTNVRFASDDNPIGYAALLAFKACFLMFFAAALLHLFGLAADPSVAIKSALTAFLAPSRP